jgi:hypothetical protein
MLTDDNSPASISAKRKKKKMKRSVLRSASSEAVL